MAHSLDKFTIDFLITEVTKRRDSRLLISYLRKGGSVTPELAQLIADLLEGKKKANPNRKKAKPDPIMVKKYVEIAKWLIRGEAMPCDRAKWPLPSDSEIAYLIDCDAVQKILNSDDTNAKTARAAVKKFKINRPAASNWERAKIDGKRLLPYLVSMCSWLSDGRMPPWTSHLRERPSGEDISMSLKNIGVSRVPERKGEITEAAKKMLCRMLNLTKAQLDIALIPRKRKQKNA